MIKYFLFISVLFFSCSDIKLTSSTGYKPAFDTTSKKVYALTQFDSVPRISKLIGNFEMRENEDGNWFNVYQKLKEFSLQNNANTLKIDQYHVGGYGTKGNAGFITGRLYYTNIDSLTTINKKDSIYLYVLRYEKDNFIATNSNVDLIVNNKQLGNLDNLAFYKINVQMGDTLILSTSKQKSKFTFVINKKTDQYIRISKQTFSNVGFGIGLSIMVGVGDVNFYELTPLNGRLELENIQQIKNLK